MSATPENNFAYPWLVPVQTSLERAHLVSAPVELWRIYESSVEITSTEASTALTWLSSSALQRGHNMDYYHVYCYKPVLSWEQLSTTEIEDKVQQSF